MPEQIAVPEPEIARGFDGVRRSIEGPSAILLSRSPDTDPTCTASVSAARAVDVPWVRLPDDAALARWVVQMALEWIALGEPALERALLGVVSLLPVERGMPSVPLAGSVEHAPAMPTRMLSRYVRLLSIDCALCGGGGMPGRMCGRCRQPLPEAA